MNLLNTDGMVDVSVESLKTLFLNNMTKKKDIGLFSGGVQLLLED